MTSHTIAHMHYTSLHIYSFVLCMYQAETSWTCIRHVQLYYRQELRQNFDYSNTTDVVVQPSKPVVVPLPPYYYSQYTWQLQKKKNVLTNMLAQAYPSLTSLISMLVALESREFSRSSLTTACTDVITWELERRRTVSLDSWCIAMLFFSRQI